jgi:hypothetical protein
MDPLPEFRILTIMVNKQEPEDVRYVTDDFAPWELEGLFKYILQLEEEALEEEALGFNPDDGGADVE